MAGYRKLGRTADQRKALIRGQVTSLLQNGKIVTTESRAKEIRKVAEGLIALAVKEQSNFDIAFRLFKRGGYANGGQKFVTKDNKSAKGNTQVCQRQCHSQ